MADNAFRGKPPRPIHRVGQKVRLEPGQLYFDLDHPERGPFVASGDEDLGPEANIVAETDVDASSWERLLAEGWGINQVGAGDRSYDQGAFGQEDDPRSDVLNSAPPGVGEGFSSEESGAEKPHR